MLELIGEEATVFANAIFRPSAEYIKERQESIAKISAGVRITPNGDGFNVEIDTLELPI